MVDSLRRRILLGLAILGIGLVSWLGLTDHPQIWPVRNTLQYHLFQRWDALMGRSTGQPVTVRGTVRSPAGTPIHNAQVLVAAHDGTPFSASTDATGNFVLNDVPAGSYVPVAGAVGYQNTAVRQFNMLRTRLDGTTPLDITLTPVTPRPVAPARNFQLGEPEALQIQEGVPFPAAAIRRSVYYEVGARPITPTLYYTPNDGRDTPLPTLLAVYPGPANTWETVSFPLAQAGYAVIAVGPAYALDLEEDVDDLERLLHAVQEGHFPRADAQRIGTLGGSYSGLHIFRLLQRQAATALRQPVATSDPPSNPCCAIRASLFLGPPTDLFVMRRQFAAGEIFPPFGLDQALIALGFPDRNPEPYWRYSTRYHARALQAPLMLIHSKVDEIVPFEQSQLLSNELTRIGMPHELHILEGMGHYLFATERTPAIEALFELTINFFEQHLR